MRLIALTILSGALTSAQTGFSVSSIDTSANACTDFYQYACGNWMKSNPIPPDQARWSRFNELADRNLNTLRDILQTAAAKQNRTAVEQKIGDFYAACMNEPEIERLGTEPLKPELDRIASLADKRAVAGEIVRLHRQALFPLFRFYSRADNRNAKMIIAQADQGGLTLPDRDYYLKTDAKSTELRDQYVAHVTRMFELLGDTRPVAGARARTVLNIETALAKASMDRVARRNPNNTYHPMSKSEFVALTPSFDFNDYFGAVGAPAFDRLNVANPEFFKSLDSVLTSTPLADLKTYLDWKYVHGYAEDLPKRFVEENFAFFGRKLGGARELKPRWKRCVEQVDNDLGEALGQKYVEVAFGPQAKERMTEMIRNLETAVATDINALDWMGPETKKRALAKLEAIQNKIGYPERWRDYSSVVVKPDDALGNDERASAFEFAYEIRKISHPPDLKEWRMTPPTVNAYYSPQENNINFPAGILQPPFFDPKLDDAVNYGGIGAVIGHEITHGFDDQGRRFDAEGNMTDWWTAEDAKRFEERAACIDKQYGNYVAVADVKLNGKLTLGENTADNGGLRVAYMALEEAMHGKPKPKIDGYTPEQRFFLGWAQVWCQNITDEQARLRALTDPHSPGKYRVNGTLSNMPEFQKAFGCRQGDAMVSANACRVW